MIIEAIYTILSGNSALVAACDLYAIQAKKTAANPCLIYSISGQDPEYTKDGQAPVIYTSLEIDIFVNGTPKTAYTIAALVKTALDQYSGTANGQAIDLIQFEGMDDGGYDPDRDEYSLGMGFRIRTK